MKSRRSASSSAVPKDASGMRLLDLPRESHRQEYMASFSYQYNIFGFQHCSWCTGMHAKVNA